MVSYRIPVLAGDGIGPEIIREGKKVIEATAEVLSFNIEWVDLPYCADYYLTTGKLIDEGEMKDLASYKTIYLGALGDPRVSPGILEQGIILALRFYFDEYVNLRPVKLYEGVETPLKNKGPEDIDFDVIRENTEDMYISLGERVGKGQNRFEHELKRKLYDIKFGLDVDSDHDEIAYQLMVISRRGAERIIRYAFERCRSRSRSKVTSVDKANVLSKAYGLWRDVFEEVRKEYPDIKTEYTFVDAITMWFVKNPEWFQVVVSPNMFGDIITDLAAMIQGGLGVAVGANINPDGTSMFEPIHGSAPKYKNTGKANPIATILAGGLLLDHLGEAKASVAIEEAVKEVLKEGKIRTPDLGGLSKTSEVGDIIAVKAKEKAVNL